MRILIAHSFYRIPGGEDRYVEQQVELLRAGHTVELIAERNEDLADGSSTARRMVGSRAHRAEMEAWIAAFEPDVVHLHNAYPALGPSVHKATRALDIPLAMTVHNYRLRCPNGLMFTEGQPCRRCLGGNHINAVMHDCFPSRAQATAYATALWVHRFVLHLERDVSLFITPSEFMNRTLAGWGIETTRITTVRNFTDQVPDVTSTGTYGLYLGRLSSEKGLDVLLRALAEAGDPDFRIAGEGLFEARLRALASELGLKNTRFLGPVPHDEVASLLAEARVLVLPSIWDENAPLSALEAMAHGVPLLVTDKGGLPELAGNGRGIVCPASDPQALSDGLRRLMGGDEREALGRAARTFAAEHLTADRHRSGLEQAYETLLERYKTER